MRASDATSPSKVLPAAFSADADRLSRFEQEARAAAALNHPNILAVYDIGTHPSTIVQRVSAVVREVVRARRTDLSPNQEFLFDWTGGGEGRVGRVLVKAGSTFKFFAGERHLLFLRRDDAGMLVLSGTPYVIRNEKVLNTLQVENPAIKNPVHGYSLANEFKVIRTAK